MNCLIVVARVGILCCRVSGKCETSYYGLFFISMICPHFFKPFPDYCNDMTCVFTFVCFSVTNSQVSRKLVICEGELDKAEKRADVAERYTRTPIP